MNPSASESYLWSDEEIGLRHVRPPDLARLFDIEQTGPRSVLYRHRGRTLSPDEFSNTVYRGAHAHLVMVSLSDETVRGSCALYDYDQRAGHAKVSVIHDNTDWSKRRFIRGIGGFIEWVFSSFPIRKLYADVLEPNLDQFKGVVDVGLLREEGRLLAHDFANGDYVDLLVLALYREEWHGSDLMTRPGDIARDLGGDQEEP